jgi:ATP-dependent Lon protease
MTDEQKPKSAEDVDIIKEYNQFLDDIPWKNLQALPKKLEKWAPYVGIKDTNQIDIVEPVKRVVEFIGVLVKRIRRSEKKIIALEQKIKDLEKSD